MNYYLDTEFNGYQGELISLALVSENGRCGYYVFPPPANLDPWVAANVLPIVEACPVIPIVLPRALTQRHLAALLRNDGLLGEPDRAPHVIADWPVDIQHLCDLLITGPGTMIDIPGITFEVKRVDAYPTTLAGAVQHNAWRDAMALRHKLTTEKTRA